MPEENEQNNEGENNNSPSPTPTTPTPTSSKTFTQDQVNTLLAEERRKGQKANERTIKELIELKKNAQLTTEEKEKLESRIEDLRTEYMTKEEISKRELKKESERAKKEQDALTKERDLWRDRYISSTIERELYDVAAQDAYNPLQFVNLLKPNTRLAEELDAENQPTGRLVARVRLTGKDKDGNDVVLDLSPTEAIKQMKDMPEQYGNLFKSGAHSGAGGNNNSSARTSGGPPLSDAAAYRQWRGTAGLKRK